MDDIVIDLSEVAPGSEDGPSSICLEPIIQEFMIADIRERATLTPAGSSFQGEYITQSRMWSAVADEVEPGKGDATHIDVCVLGQDTSFENLRFKKNSFLLLGCSLHFEPDNPEAAAEALVSGVIYNLPPGKVTSQVTSPLPPFMKNVATLLVHPVRCDKPKPEPTEVVVEIPTTSDTTTP